LSDDELRRPLPAGWTVAALLAHLAFWDARALFLLDKWGRGVAPSTADDEPADVDWINEAAQLALRLAEEADRRVAALSDALLARLRASGGPVDLRRAFNVARAHHRQEHLDEIEHALRA
jgi:hypothetical protein